MNLVHLPLFIIFEWTRLSESEQENLVIDYVITCLVLQLTWHLFLTSESLGNTTVSFIYLIIYTPDLIRVAQDYQGWNSICCSLVHPFTSVFWRHGIFFENRLSMALRPLFHWFSKLFSWFFLDFFHLWCAHDIYFLKTSLYVI